jgi:hypothetical protein
MKPNKPEKKTTENWLTLDEETKTSVGEIADRAWKNELEEFVELLAQGIQLPTAEMSAQQRAKVYHACTFYENLKLTKLNSLIAMARIKSINLTEKKTGEELKVDIVAEAKQLLSKRVKKGQDE